MSKAKVKKIYTGGCKRLGNAIVCSSPQYEVEFEGRVSFIEIHSYCGPHPLRKDTMDPYKGIPPSFWRLWDACKGEIAEAYWRDKYRRRIFDLCQDEDMAEMSAEAAEYEIGYDPEGCAEDEVSYWGD